MLNGLKWMICTLYGAIMSALTLFTVQSVAAEKKQITLLAGLVKPPFIVEENGHGLQLDIIREALALSNVSVNFAHVPIARHVSNYQKLGFDGIITLSETTNVDDIYYSNPYIYYQNVALSLSSNNFVINDVADLSFKDISAFQNAHKFLGTDFEFAISQAKEYREFADQNKQLRSLYEHATEVVVADVNIYNYFKKNRQGGIYNSAVTVHHIFPMRGYVAGFRDKEIRDKFTQGVERLKLSGKYLAILARYKDDDKLLSKKAALEKGLAIN